MICLAVWLEKQVLTPVVSWAVRGMSAAAMGV